MALSGKNLVFWIGGRLWEVVAMKVRLYLGHFEALRTAHRLVLAKNLKQ